MRHPRLLAAASVALALVLSACGSSTDEDSSTATADSTASAAFPVTIENTFGDVTIESEPKRVATVAWANHEVPLALGVVPVGMSKATWGDDDGDGVLPWVEDKLGELDAETPVLFDETEGIDFEAVADTRPDVILASYSGLTKEEYDTLSKIAPVVSFPKLAWGTTMWEMVELNSRAIGLADEGEKLTAELKKQVSDAVEARPALKGKSAMFAHLDPNDLSQVGYYTTHDSRVGFLEEAGMVSPPVVSQASSKSDEFYLTTSAEENDKLADVDIFVTYGSQKLLSQVQKDPLMAQIPAVKRGSVALLEDSTPLAAAANPTPLSIGWGIDDYLDVVEGAAAKVG
jgi:iron complex transport system substrate-binding protein